MKHNKQNFMLIFSLSLCGSMLLLSGCSEIRSSPSESPTALLSSNTPPESEAATSVPTMTSTSPENEPSPSSPFPAQVGDPPELLGLNYVLDKEREVVYSFDVKDNVKCIQCDKTRVWDFKEWRILELDVHPQGRSGASFAYDPIRKVSVLFGGIGEDGKCLDDTWLWNGTDWTIQDLTTSPSPRYDALTAFDEAHKVLFLFGGYAHVEKTIRPIAFNDVWTWDGSVWTQIVPSLEDRNDYPRFIAYDAAQQQIVGINESQTLTWDWTENKWVNANSEIHYIKGGDMAYDSSHQQMIFLADSDSGLKPDLLLWNGETWSLGPIPEGLAGVSSTSTLLDDPIHRGLLLFGYKEESENGHWYNSAWFWNGTDWTPIY